MKAGEVVTFAHREGATLEGVTKSRRTERSGAPLVAGLVHYGTHSDETYGISDASEPVTAGTCEYVIVCKVLAVVRRSVKVET